jgi:hypothetical protein
MKILSTSYSQRRINHLNLVLSTGMSAPLICSFISLLASQNYDMFVIKCDLD